MQTFQIHIEGKVQGVGFRPFVYQLAKKMALKGWVNNGSEGVKIEVSGRKQVLESFVENLQLEKPKISYITKIFYQKIPFKNFQDFRIIHSEDKGKKRLLLTSDLDTCEECLEDFYNPKSRFFHYPFVACTNCGTRYSIIKKLPYDRENTVMQDFAFCEDCQVEYDNPNDRRFYTQNHSCEKCGIELYLYNTQNQILEQGFDSLAKSIELLRQGKILAVKGIGGFLLIADASNQNTIKVLRNRKHRPSKPFALMYPDLASIEKDVFISEKEKQALKSREKPIVILQVREKLGSKVCIEEIVPEIYPKKLGIMLPYTALFDYVLQEIQKPLIATSANLSNSPIIFEDEKALSELNQIADFILLNNRPILVPQDDSVLRFSPKSQQKIVIRRSRGFAPNSPLQREVIQYNNAKVSKFSSTLAPNNSILCLGAELKSSFTLTHEGNIYVSQYLGNLQSFEGQENFKKTLLHFLDLFDAQPDMVVSDKHPAYFTTNLAEEFVKKWSIDKYQIQHHEAHFGSVLYENDLLNNDVLGVIWDGTGLGNDGQIWGGEFFAYQNKKIRRIEHFEYFPHFLADKMPKEPRISALAICRNIAQAQEILAQNFTKVEWNLYQTLLKNKVKLYNSSLGRIFDALASLLGLGDKQSFEGENAMKLEALAQEFYQSNFDFYESYEATLSTERLFVQILKDILNDKDKKEIAFKFHITLIIIIEKIAQKYHLRKIAFSGGVWQNALLVDLAIQYLRPKFEIYFHKQLSPNDENVSFGQLASILSEKMA